MIVLTIASQLLLSIHDLVFMIFPWFVYLNDDTGFKKFDLNIKRRN